MHELAIAESVIETIRDKTGDRTVLVIRLEIGTLAGVLVDSLRFCFELAAADTPLAAAELQISQPVGMAHCRTCGADFGVSDLILLCECGSVDVDVLDGQQLRISSVEVG
jgi:hydrogenase nickel incorporation protein HypA/HybF